MQENETYSPTSILYGWKEADKDVQNNIIDPSMGKNPPAPQIQHSAPAGDATGGKAQASKAAENAAATTSEKPATTKNEKPDQGTTEKKAVR